MALYLGDDVLSSVSTGSALTNVELTTIDDSLQVIRVRVGSLASASTVGTTTSHILLGRMIDWA